MIAVIKYRKNGHVNIRFMSEEKFAKLKRNYYDLAKIYNPVTKTYK
jgi:hypothetical protein